MRVHNMVAAAVTIASASVACGQTTRHVDGSNTCPGAGSAVDPFCSIQGGIDAATDGDEVVVQPGTYLEAIDFGGRAITVRSASGNPTDTIIDGTGHFHVVHCVNGEGANSVLGGFTITGGSATGAGFPNTDDRGGGMYNNGTSPTVTDCVFSSNIADVGGGIYNDNSSPAVTNCRFLGNVATSPLLVGGGGMFNMNSSPTISQCVFSGNSGNTGGAIYNNGGTVTVAQCSFSGNSSPFGGGAMLNNFSSPTISNSIFWANTTTELLNTNGSAPLVTFSDIQGGYVGADNIDADPTFIDADGADNTLGTSDDDLGLQLGSPCIDQGDNDSIPAGILTDLNGDSRVSNGTVDMGALELQDDDGDGVLDDVDLCPGFDDAIDSDGDGVPNGCDTASVHNLTQATDHFTVQGAIDSSFDGDAIVVDPGTYHEAIDLIGRAIALRSTSGDPTNTIIDGSGHIHVVQCVSGEGPDTVLEGFTITGGNATEVVPDDRGGGMYCFESNPTVRHCIFRNNTATAGGGMFVGSRIGVPARTVVRDCVFMDNDAKYGGGFYDQASEAIVHRCRFIRNASLDGGGGYFMQFVGSNIISCLFSMNSGDPKGRAIYVQTSHRALITNCTVYDELAGGADVQLYADADSENIQVTNSLFRSSFGSQILDVSNTASVSYCNLERGFPGIGNFDANPLFVDPDGADNVAGTLDDDLRIQTGSPCIDAGNSEVILLAFSSDLDAKQRVVDDPLRADTGVGIPEVVDIGAYEFGSTPNCKSIQGDFDCDGDVDLEDFTLFMLLFAGPF